MKAGKICTCNDCKYADKEEMKCRPQSKDCRSEYDLEELDFVKLRCCDFYRRKEQENGRVFA